MRVLQFADKKALTLMADGFEIALGELADGNTIRAWAQGTTNRLDEQLIEAAYLSMYSKFE